MGIKDWFRRHKNLGPTLIGHSQGGALLLKYGDKSFDNSRVGFLEDSMLELVKRREKIYEETFGKPDLVYHEVIPFVPHVDVYQFLPARTRSFYTYVTGGMSDLPMNSPDVTGNQTRRVELVLYTAESKPEYSELLRKFAHFPHDNSTWLHWGHTMSNGTPPEPVFEPGPLDAFLFMPSILRPDFELGERLQWDEDQINLLWCVPITTAECNFALERGVDALYEVFASQKHPFVFRGQRESYV